MKFNFGFKCCLILVILSVIIMDVMCVEQQGTEASADYEYWKKEYEDLKKQQKKLERLKKKARKEAGKYNNDHEI